MALDAILFDLDGTLVDTNPLHVEAWRRAFDQHGYRVPADRLFIEIGKGGDHLVHALIGREGEERDGDDLRKAQPRVFSQLAADQSIRVFPGAVELLREVRRRGLKTSLCTSSEKAQLDIIVKYSGVDWPGLADFTTTAADAKKSKPSPDIVSAAVKKLGMSPAQCALIGDTPYDAHAGRDSGVVCLGLECGGRSADDLRRAGARKVWRDPAHLLSNLDAALHAASPTAIKLTQQAMEELMRRALAAAKAGLEAGEAPIGCVLARGDGSILATAHNSANATNDRTAHAEMVAFRAAAKQIPEDADDLILVSTLEPCVMCLGAAMEAAVDTVLYGLKAPTDGGVQRVNPPQSPEAIMPRIVGDILASESRTLFKAFLKRPNINEKAAAYVQQLLTATDS